MQKTLKAVMLAGVLAAPTAAAAQDAPAAAQQPTILVTSVVPGLKAPDGNYSGAVVQFDLINGDLQKSLSGQSTRLVIDIDCAGEKIRARNMIVYKEPKQGGAAAEVRIKDDWESYRGGAYLADVARSICKQDGNAPSIAPTSAPKPSVTPLVAHSPMPSAAVTAAPAANPGERGATIQFVSSTSEVEVNDDISKLKSHLGRDGSQFRFTVEVAVIKGAKHYRGRVGPFTNQIDAQHFCSKIAEINMPCLVIGK